MMKIVGIHPVEVSDVWTLELELIFKELKNSDLACLSLDSTVIKIVIPNKIFLPIQIATVYR